MVPDSTFRWVFLVLVGVGVLRSGGVLEGVQSGQAGGEQVLVRGVPGQPQPDSSGSASNGPGDGEQLQPQPFRFPAARSGAGQGEHLQPRGQLRRQLHDGDPDLILRERGQRQVPQAALDL